MRDGETSVDISSLRGTMPPSLGPGLPGGWHEAFGGGLTFTTLRHTLSLAYARGETGRFYLELGFPF